MTNFASMEPRFFKRGNFSTRSFIVAKYRVLQWNHVFSNVEMVDRFFAVSQNPFASMEPRFFKRGNMRNSEWRVKKMTNASMEPRFFKRGNSNQNCKTSRRFWALQWNHVFSNVEMLFRRSSR